MTESVAKLSSAVYEGRVRHRRYAPHAHCFNYPMAQLYLDLDELDTVFRRHPLWSTQRRNVAEFRRRDYLGGDEGSLADAVRERVHLETGRRPLGPIRMLTHLRYFGHIFNPVTLYYCFEPKPADDSGEPALDCIVAEITNTPWKERHSYVLPVSVADIHGRSMCWGFPKLFHVSPFMPMDRGYAWRFTVPGDDLHVHMDVLRDGEAEFDASMTMHRRALDSTALARVLWRYPLMTMQVVTAIHWQAARLWLKGNPVHTHPKLKTHRLERHRE